MRPLVTLAEAGRSGGARRFYLFILYKRTSSSGGDHPRTAGGSWYVRVPGISEINIPGSERYKRMPSQNQRVPQGNILGHISYIVNTFQPTTSISPVFWFITILGPSQLSSNDNTREDVSI